MQHPNTTCAISQPPPVIEYRRCGALTLGDLTQHAGGACTCDSPDFPFIVVALTSAGQDSVDVTWMHEACRLVCQPTPCADTCEVAYFGHTDEIPDPDPGIARACARDELLNQCLDVGNAELIADNIASRVATALTAYAGRRGTPILAIIRQCASAELDSWRAAIQPRVADAATRASEIATRIADRAETWIGRPAAPAKPAPRTVRVRVENVYGNDLVYPDDDTARTFASVCRKKSFNAVELDLIRRLGYQVEVAGCDHDLPQGFRAASDIIGPSGHTRRSSCAAADHDRRR